MTLVVKLFDDRSTSPNFFLSNIFILFPISMRIFYQWIISQVKRVPRVKGKTFSPKSSSHATCFKLMKSPLGKLDTLTLRWE